MKNILFILFFVYSYSFSQNNNAILGINFGMKKSEIKKEFKSNKEKYTKIDLGGYLWRYYYQKNLFNVK